MNYTVEEKETRNKLVEENQGLVLFVANQYTGSGVEFEDLSSIGMIGLVKAADTFRPEQKVKFATYAVPCIRNEIRMYLRRNKKHKREISTNFIVGADEDGNKLHLFDILGTEPDVVTRRSEEEADGGMLLSALATLPSKEQTILNMLFGMGQEGGSRKSLKEVGEQLGVSGSYISRLKKRALGHLRSELMRMAG